MCIIQTCVKLHFTVSVRLGESSYSVYISQRKDITIKIHLKQRRNIVYMHCTCIPYECGYVIIILLILVITLVSLFIILSYLYYSHDLDFVVVINTSSGI